MTTADLTAAQPTFEPAAAVRPTVAREYTRWLLEREADLAAKVAAVTRLASSWSAAHPPATDGQDGTSGVAELAAELLRTLEASSGQAAAAPVDRERSAMPGRVSQHFQLAPTTGDELDAQEPTSIVRSGDGEVWKKGEDDLWRSTGSGALTSGTLARTGPLTLLFSPAWVPVSDLDQVLLEAGLANLWTTRPERRTDVEEFLDTHPTWLLDVSLAPQMPSTRSA